MDDHQGPRPDYLVFTRQQFDAGIAELATLSFHGGFLARREIGEPVAELFDLPRQGRTLGQLAAQMHADSCAWFPTVHGSHEDTVVHAALGIGGESGEVLDIVKKADICGLTDTCDLHADGKHSLAALGSEIADVLTYLLVLAHECGIDVQAAYEAKRAVNVDRWGDPADRDRAEVVS